MKTVHVCLVSDQPIPNLTTVMQFKPDTAVLLYTSDKRVQKDRLSMVIRSKGACVEEREIQPYGMGNVIAECESVIESFRGAEISLNITGGTKIGTLGSFQAFFSADLPIYYVNTRDNRIIQVVPEEHEKPIDVKIRFRDYLAAYGFFVESVCKDTTPLFERRAATDALRDLAVKSERSLGILNASFPDNLERSSFPLETEPLDDAALSLAPVLEKCGIATRGENGNLRVDSLGNANYLRGFWFEEYVYMAACGAGADEVALNVTGTWDAMGREPPRNEFDVMLSKGNRLFLISCKTRNPNVKAGNEGIGKDFLYELDSLGDQALGLFGRKMLASARPVVDRHVRKRAQVMGIRIFDRNDLVNLKGKIRQWLGE